MTIDWNRTDDDAYEDYTPTHNPDPDTWKDQEPPVGWVAPDVPVYWTAERIADGLRKAGAVVGEVG